MRQRGRRRSGRHSMLGRLSTATTVVAIIVAATISLVGATAPVAQDAAWPASGRDGVAGTLGMSSDGVRLNVGCNFRLGPGARATVHNYRGDALRRIADRAEPISLEVVRRDGSSRSFRADMHYYAPDDGHVVSDHLPVAFLEAFAGGERLILRNGAGVSAAEWELTGTAAAVRTMRGICRF